VLHERKAHPRMRASHLYRFGAMVVCVAVTLLAALPAPSRAATHARFFWVASAGGLKREPCVLRGSARDVDVFVCPGARETNAHIDDLISRYETGILPTDLRTFGRPRGFGRISIVIAHLDDMSLGYFDENDLAATDPLHANHGNVVYVRPAAMMPDKNGQADVLEVVAHELQHVINYRIRVMDDHHKPEEAWLNEGLSFYAQMINGFWTPRDALKVQAAAADPNWPVNGLQESNRFLYRHARVAYGRAGLFLTDLAQRYGAHFARSLIATPDPGLGGLDTVLRHAHPRGTVQSAFARWGVDLLLNRVGATFSKSRAATPAFHQALAIPSVAVPSAPLPAWRSPWLQVNSWAQSYTEFRSVTAGTLHVTLSTANPAIRAAVVVRSSRSLSPPRVVWCRPQGKVSAAQVEDFGGPYDQATLVVSGAPSIGGREKDWRFQVGAALVDVGDHDRITGPAAPTGRNARVPVRKTRHLP
jgi:hypothetical protein